MELIFYSASIFAALLVSCAAVLVFGFWLHCERFIRQYVAPLIPVFIVLAIGISSIVSGRDVSMYGLSGASMVTSASWLGSWILRLVTALIVVASVAVAFSGLMHKKPGKDAGGYLFMAFAAYFTSCYVVSGVFGSEPSFTHNNFYAPIIFFAAYVLRDQGADRFIRWTRDGLNVFIFAGLVVAVVLPQIALQKGYGGLIPQVGFRYWGIASHANNIGPIAIFFLLLLRWKPYKWQSLTVLSALMALLSLLLSQSKTAWIGGAVALMVLLGYRIIHVLRGIKGGKNISLTQFALVCSPFFLSAVLIVGLTVGVEFGLGGRALLEAENQLSTLTGRDVIWSITLREWQDNPLFGYGPSLWGPEFAYREGYLGIASNAHNQFVDVLGSSGLLGLLCFLVYLQLLVRYAWASAGSTHGVSLALAIFIVVRSITEVPLKTATLMTTDFAMHFILFSALLQSKFALTAGKKVPAAKSMQSRVPKTQLSS
jgi:O-antigen ligase